MVRIGKNRGETEGKTTERKVEAKSEKGKDAAGRWEGGQCHRVGLDEGPIT